MRVVCSANPTLRARAPLGQADVRELIHVVPIGIGFAFDHADIPGSTIAGERKASEALAAAHAGVLNKGMTSGLPSG